MKAAPPSTFSAPRASLNRRFVIEGAFYRLHHAMISYFRRFSIHYYYTTIINTTLDQDMNFFLPSIANIKKRMMQLAGGQTLLVLALFLPSTFYHRFEQKQDELARTPTDGQSPAKGERNESKEADAIEN